MVIVSSSDDKNNDSSNLTSLMKADASALREWVDPRTVMVVDRGFRDALAFLEELGFISKMPYFLEEGSQHSSQRPMSLGRLQVSVG